MKASIDEDDSGKVFIEISGLWLSVYDELLISGLSPISPPILFSDSVNSNKESSDDEIFRSFSFEDRMHSSDEIRKERSLLRILLAAKERYFN